MVIIVAVALSALTVCVYAGSAQAGPWQHHGIRVAVASSGCPPSVCAALLPALEHGGMAPTTLDGAALAKLTKADYDVLVLTSAPLQLTAEVAPAYFSFAQAGGHLVVLGGRPARLNITASFAALNLMDTYEPYRLRSAVSVEPLPAATTVAGSPPPTIAGAVSGLSAIGFPRQGQSLFVPLMHAVDRHNRSTGWAFSAMINTGGPYNGSVWLLSGIREPAFLASPAFVATLVATLKTSASRPNVLVDAATSFREDGLKAQRAAVAAMAVERNAASPSPPGFIKTGSAHSSSAGAASPSGSPKGKGKHLLYAADGSRYFMLGGDYFRGMFNSSLNADTLAIDLRNAVLSGLNTLRFYGFPVQLAGGQGPSGPAVMALLRQMHKEHGLRVLFTLPAYKDKSQTSKSSVITSTKADAIILANETWVLGYDLANEPDDQYVVRHSLRPPLLTRSCSIQSCRTATKSTCATTVFMVRFV